MNHQKTTCAHTGCDKAIRRVNKSGLCKAHYNSARSWRISCAHCVKVINPNKSGLCFNCLKVARSKRCAECGGPYAGHSRLNGKCITCHRKGFISLQVPEERRADYWVLRTRGIPAQEAAQHILDGKEVIRKQVRRGIPNVTVPTNVAIKHVADALRISEKEILSDSRFGETVDARSVVIEVMSRQGMSYPRIGQRLNRDHSSIQNLRKKFPMRVAKRPHLGELVDTILGVAA